MTTENSSCSPAPKQEWFPFQMADSFLWNELHCAGIGTHILERGQELALDTTPLFPISNNYFILYIMSGTIQISIKDSLTLLEPGFLLIASPSTLIKIDQIIQGGTCCFVFLGGTIADQYLDKIVAELGVCFSLGKSQTISAQITQLLNSIYLGIAVDDTYGSLFAYQFLLSLYHFYSDSSQQSCSPLVRSAIDILTKEYAYLYGIDELSEKLQVSKSYLIRLFTKQLGISPGKYLTYLRIENAKLLLMSNDYSVETVANMVGYSDSNYFCKVFKKQIGLTPKQFATGDNSMRNLPTYISRSEGFVY